MLWNWMMVALRNLLRHRLYTGINIVGLSAGLAAALLILVFVRHELSYDRMFSGADQTWRLVRTEYLSGREPSPTSAQSMPLTPALLQAFSEVEGIVRIGRAREIVRRGDETLYQVFNPVDPTYFTFFDWPLLSGDPATALAQPNSTVLTRAVATKLFGDADPMGRTLQLESGIVLTVTGVMKDQPANVSDQVEALVSISTPLKILQRNRESWNNHWITTYVRLRPGTDVDRFRADLKDFITRTRPSQNDGVGYRVELSLQPLLDVHTHPLRGEPGTSLAALSGLVALAVLILLIAAINFVNLATAHATMRAREVALRKTLGARRSLIIVQFLGESLMLTFLAGLLALAVVELSMAPFQQALEVRIDPAFSSTSLLAGMALSLSLVLGLLGGFYPAIVLSAFRPAQVLRANRSAGIGGGHLRTALVVAQFAVAIGLSVGTLVVLQQTRFASSQQLGFDKENVVLLRGVGNAAVLPKLETLKDRLRADPGVVAVAGAPWAPSDNSERTSSYVRTDDGWGEQLTIRTDPVDYGYFEVLGARLLAGRFFDRAYGTDEAKAVPEGSPSVEGRTAAAVISETAVRQLGWNTPEQAIGKTLLYPEDQGDITLHVIGVVADLQYKSARDSTVASIYHALPSDADTLMVRIRSDAAPAVLNRIDSLWREMVPTIPVRRQFLDERIDALYANDIRQGRLFGAFAGLAVVIACLGLFGLASFTAERRTKEIGIRKVLGASVPQLVRLLVWQFSRPVLIANLIAWPLSWYWLSRWLQGFAYRINLDPLIFVAVGAGALIIAWGTVAGHAARVASAKPITALRYE